MSLGGKNKILRCLWKGMDILVFVLLHLSAHLSPTPQFSLTINVLT